MASDAATALRRVPLFASLGDRELEQLARECKERTFAAGETITSQDARGVAFFVIADGTARVTRGEDDAGALGPGDYFGEIALLRDVPRTATVTAVTDSRLYALERDAFLTAVTGHAASRAAGEAVVEERLAPVA